MPPGRLHLVGYFEGIDSARGLEWRCSDSLSLREFLRLESRDRVPDHSWLSRTRARLPHEVHTAIFDWVLALIAEAGCSRASASGSMPRRRPTRRCATSCGGTRARVTGGCWRLGPGERHRDTHGRGPGAPGPQAQGQAALERTGSKSDPEAKIAKMKDGTTHLAYKPEHAVPIWTPARWWPPSYTRPTRAHDDAGEDSLSVHTCSDSTLRHYREPTLPE